MQRRYVQEPAASAPPAPVSKPTDITSRSYKSVPPASNKTSIIPPRSQFIKETLKAERRELKFPSLRRFVKPVLVSTLLCIIIIGLILGGIYATRFFSQNAEPGVLPPATAITPSKRYTLSTNIIPETGGKIDIVPPSSGNGTFDPGSQVTLTAVPNDCHTFSYWDGVADSSETVNITMDSNKSITANFRLKETTPPVISEVKADSNSDISATITWLTDKPATGQVDYGKTKDYGLTAISNDELTTNHKVRMTGLEPNTTYYFSVKSSDKCGSEASATKMLITLREIKLGERVGERALDFTLPYYNDDNPESPNKAGKTETLSTYIGKKKILLNFWSTFCGACIGEFPFIRGIYEDEELADRNSENADFVVFTVCIDSKIDEAPGRIKTLEGKFSDEAGRFTFPILFDSVGQTKKDYHIWTIPETVFIDSDGIIREIQIGRFQSQEEIEAILKSLD
jgi:thiol-disulfide isomerase/thioredoxin